MKRKIMQIMIVGIINCCSISLYSHSNMVRAESNYDLYTAGRIGTGNFHEDTACYWINDIRHNLFPSKSRISALFIDGKDVYISGYYQKDGKIQPCYWKNGTHCALEINGTAYTSDIFVSGKDVYVAGHHKVTNETIPCCWKNGVKSDLEILDNASGFTKSITGNGKDFYIAGFLISARDKESKIDACYWKNGKLIQLNSSPYKYSIASQICVDKENVYIAGRLDDTEKECLCLWKDNTRNDYSIIPNKYSGRFLYTWEGADYYSFSREEGLIKHKFGISSMSFIDGGVYIVGKRDDKACYWINGKMTQVTEDGEDYSLGGITIIDQNILIAGTSEKSICVWENGAKREIVKLNKNEGAYNYGFMKH